MATECPVFMMPGLSASADLSTHQYKFVKMSGNRTVTVCAAVTDKPIGILQNAPVSGQAAEVMAIGMSKVKASAALSAGNVIGTDGSALAIAKTVGTDVTHYLVGQVVDGVSNANEVATVAINCLNIARAA